MLNIKILGRLHVTDGTGKEISVPGSKLQALLTFLALNSDSGTSREKLVGLLWGNRFDKQARQSLRQAIAKLRRIFEVTTSDALIFDGDYLGLNTKKVTIDATQFLELSAEASPTSLAEAVRLLRGEIAEGLITRTPQFDDWLQAERQRYGQWAADALICLGELQLEMGEPASAVKTAVKLASLDSLSERACQIAMQGLTSVGQRSAAVQHYQYFSELTERELGTVPNKETRALYESIRDEARLETGHHSMAEVAVAKPQTASVIGTVTSRKPVVAVLPFDNLSGEPEQDYFTDGVSEDLITGLSKHRWLDVISRNSAFAYRGRSSDIKLVGNELGTDYAVEGSIRRSGSRIRVSAQLVDASSGKTLWAERYDRNLDEIFDVQDAITNTIVARIEPELGAAERRKVVRKRPANLEAWDCYHLGIAHFFKFTASDNLEAQRLLKQSCELDPAFGEAYAWWAYATVIGMVYWDTEPSDELLDEAIVATQRALEIDDQNATFYALQARIKLARTEYRSAISGNETAIQMNPSFAAAYCGLGDSLAYEGRYEEAIKQFEQALELSTNDPQRWAFLTYGALALIFKGDFETALEWAERARIIPNCQYWTTSHMVVALAHLNRLDEAEKLVQELFIEKPKFSCAFARKKLFYIKLPQQIELYTAGLRKAGVPEI
ncbi:MAG: hypothetical protein APF80_05880 [Alphaproteobacteria bacterium BRH_c36]|nr:MAG: hypothetical protein APF80_05880 [Alphaproteobacteria bacterium BRH_c36]